MKTKKPKEKKPRRIPNHARQPVPRNGSRFQELIRMVGAHIDAHLTNHPQATIAELYWAARDGYRNDNHRRQRFIRLNDVAEIARRHGHTIQHPGSYFTWTPTGSGIVTARKK